MSAVQTAPPRPLARTRPLVEFAILAVVAALFALTFWLVRPPPRVAHLDIVNNSSTEIEVGVSGPSRDDLLGLAVALPQRTTRVEDVVDQGDEWVFAFATADCPAEEVRVSRQRLAEAGWRIVVPARVIAALVGDCAARPPVR
jgi:hypothetical protein